MKPRTKKILIWALAITAVAVIAWLVFRKRGTSARDIINGLNVDESMRALLLNQLAIVEATWEKSIIETNAAEKGRNYQQQLVAEAAYALYSKGTITYEQMMAVVAQI